MCTKKVHLFCTDLISYERFAHYFKFIAQRDKKVMVKSKMCLVQKQGSEICSDIWAYEKFNVILTFYTTVL